MVQLVDGQIKTQIRDSSKSSEMEASRASATPTPSSSTSADDLDDLEDDDLLKSSSSEPAEPDITEVPTIYTDDDLKKLQELSSSAQKWLDENEAKQSKLKATDDPAFTIKDLDEEKKRMDDVIMDMMMKKMRHVKPPTQKPKAKPKAKPKKKADKKSKKDKKATEKESPVDSSNDKPSDEELAEALRKAGVKAEGVKLKAFDHKDEMEDETGRKLKKLNIDKDSSEEDILRAIEELTKGAAENKDDESGKGHDEL